MRDHRAEFRLATMCRVLKVERSGFYAWLKQPQSTRAREDERLLVMIEEAYLASGGVYGARNVHRDLVEAGEQLGRKRVERLMRERGLRSVRTPRKRRYGGKLAVVAPNRLQRQFTVEQPDQAWVTDITYLRTAEGWLYLAVVLDLYSRADEAESRERARAGCAADGHLATSAKGAADDPLGSGRAVRQR
jgi:putative transposase